MMNPVSVVRLPTGFKRADRSAEAPRIATPHWVDALMLGVLVAVGFGVMRAAALVEACALLGFVDLKRRVAFLTELGNRFAGAELDEEKALFRAAIAEQVSLIRFITRALEDEPSHSLEAQFVLDELEFAFRPKEARQQLETAIDWGRYAELFTYDHVSGEFKLDEEHRLDAPELDVTNFDQSLGRH